MIYVCLQGAAHCEIDAKVLKEVGLEMHLHSHSEGFRNGLVGTVLAAEGVGLAQPLVSSFSYSTIVTIAPLFFNILKSFLLVQQTIFVFTRPAIKTCNILLTIVLPIQVPGFHQLCQLVPLRGSGEAVRSLPHEPRQVEGER